MKINLDKYYTPTDLAEYCVNKTKEVIGVENITEWIEPSAGAGVFLPFLDNNYLAFDIEPEAENIERKNYLELDLPYFKGRCVIGNPPYGTRNTMSVRFFKQSLSLGDYIAFILPISQYKNAQQMYDFDLIYTENLGITRFSNKKIHCCFNIYKRPKNINKKPTNKLKDVSFVEIRNNNKICTDYDLRIMAWGGGFGRTRQLGCEVRFDGEFAKELCIKTHNNKLKDEIIYVIKNADWLTLYPMTGSPNLLQWQVVKYLREQIPQLV